MSNPIKVAMVAKRALSRLKPGLPLIVRAHAATAIQITVLEAF